MPPTVGLMPSPLDLAIYAGDIFIFELDFSLVVGGVPDYSAYSFSSQIRASQSAPTVAATFEIDDTNSNIGKVLLKLPPVDTAALVPLGGPSTSWNGTWDIQRIKDADPEDVRTMFAGSVVATLDRTRLPVTDIQIVEATVDDRDNVVDVTLVDDPVYPGTGGGGVEWLTLTTAAEWAAATADALARDDHTLYLAPGTHTMPFPSGRVYATSKLHVQGAGVNLTHLLVVRDASPSYPDSNSHQCFTSALGVDFSMDGLNVTGPAAAGFNPTDTATQANFYGNTWIAPCVPDTANVTLRFSNIRINDTANTNFVAVFQVPGGEGLGRLRMIIEDCDIGRCNGPVSLFGPDGGDRIVYMRRTRIRDSGGKYLTPFSPFTHTFYVHPCNSIVAEDCDFVSAENYVIHHFSGGGRTVPNKIPSSFTNCRFGDCGDLINQDGICTTNFIECTFIDGNHYDYGKASYRGCRVDGGGIIGSTIGRLDVSDCVFSQDPSRTQPALSGGANTHVRDTVFKGNNNIRTVAATDRMTLIDCRFENDGFTLAQGSQVEMTGCWFSGTDASGYIGLYGTSTATLLRMNGCTFVLSYNHGASGYLRAMDVSGAGTVEGWGNQSLGTLPFTSGPLLTTTSLGFVQRTLTPVAANDLVPKSYVDSAEYLRTKMVGDAHVVTDVTSTGDTLVTSPGGGFLPTDVGKTAHLTTQRVTAADASMTAGSPALTSASGSFAARDVGKIVVVDGAGASGGSLVTTIASITSSTVVQLTANAVGSVSSKVVGIGGQHHATVVSYFSATLIGLSSAPGWGVLTAGTGSIVVGTDNAAQLAADVTAAVAAGKSLYVPKGKYLIPMGAGFVSTWGGDLRVYGDGRTPTELVTVNTTLAKLTQNGVFNPAGDARATFEDFTARHVGLPFYYGATALEDTQLVLATGNTTTAPNYQELSATRVNVLGMGGFGGIAANAQCRTRIVATDCQFSTTGMAITCFRNNVAGDYAVELTRVSMSVTCPWTSRQGDSAWHPHNTYIHPNVAVVWRDVTCSNNDEGHGLHNFGSPQQRPARARSELIGCKFLNATALVANSKTGTKEHQWLIDGCIFDSCVLQMMISAATISNCTFENGGGLIAGSGNGGLVIVERNRFLSLGGSAVQVPQQEATWIFRENYLLGTMIGFTGLGAGGNMTGLVLNNEFDGADSVGAVILDSNTCPEVEFVGNVLRGVWSASLVFVASSGADDVASWRVDRNKFRGTYASNRIFRTDYNIGDGNLFGEGNVLDPAVSMGELASGQSAQFVPPNRKSPTPLTVTANVLAPDWHHQAFDVTGAATVNDIFTGGNQGKQRARSGDLFLTAVSGTVTLAHAAGGTGNLRLQGAANVTIPVGETVHLRSDPRATATEALWFQVR